MHHIHVIFNLLANLIYMKFILLFSFFIVNFVVQANGLPSSLSQQKTSSQDVNNLCNSKYIGQTVTVQSNETLKEFVDSVNTKFMSNIILDTKLTEAVNLTAEASWTSILKALMDRMGLGYKCYEDGRLMLIAEFDKLKNNDLNRRLASPVMRRIFTLRHLQLTPKVTSDSLVRQVQNRQVEQRESLETAIEHIFKADGDPRSELRLIPNINSILVVATQDKLQEIVQLIDAIDQPRRQVLIKAIIYTVKEDLLNESGSPFPLILGNSNQINYLQSTILSKDQNGILGIMTFDGTAEFLNKLFAAEQAGDIKIISRPLGVVYDRDSLKLDGGTEIVGIRSKYNKEESALIVEASRNLQIVPRVSSNSAGEVEYIELTIRCENNVADPQLTKSLNSVSINKQSMQTIVRIREGQSVLIGGLVNPLPALDLTTSNKIITKLGMRFKKRTRETTFLAIMAQMIPEK